MADYNYDYQVFHLEVAEKSLGDAVRSLTVATTYDQRKRRCDSEEYEEALRTAEKALASVEALRQAVQALADASKA